MCASSSCLVSPNHSRVIILLFMPVRHNIARIVPSVMTVPRQSNNFADKRAYGDGKNCIMYRIPAWKTQRAHSHQPDSKIEETPRSHPCSRSIPGDRGMFLFQLVSLFYFALSPFVLVPYDMRKPSLSPAFVLLSLLDILKILFNSIVYHSRMCNSLFS